MTKGFNVYHNNRFVTFIPERSQAGIKRFISSYPIGTHMAEWNRVLTIRPEDMRKTCFEWSYNTSVGIYLTFKPAFTGNISKRS